MCVCVCVRACVRACARACVRVCVKARACVQKIILIPYAISLSIPHMPLACLLGGNLNPHQGLSGLLFPVEFPYAV